MTQSNPIDAESAGVVAVRLEQRFEPPRHAVAVWRGTPPSSWHDDGPVAVVPHVEQRAIAVATAAMKLSLDDRMRAHVVPGRDGVFVRVVHDPASNEHEIWRNYDVCDVFFDNAGHEHFLGSVQKIEQGFAPELPIARTDVDGDGVVDTVFAGCEDRIIAGDKGGTLAQTKNTCSE